MGDWLLAGSEQARRHSGPHAQPEPEHQRHHWLRVMCLTGVDYFSTLGYQPGIALLAAGALSPVATAVLVVVTLCGALPVYRRVAVESPRGEGSIAMLEKHLSWWKGKLLVLVLLGFACTDFLITITLSAADASAHLLENPYAPDVFAGHHVALTLVLLAALAAVFLRGFTEAVGIATVLVAVYLVLSLTVISVSLVKVVSHPSLLGDWHRLLVAEHPNPAAMVGVALIVFPKLALGLSGFETGVAVMPLIRGAPGDTEDRPAGRILGARRLLTTAALIMAVLLLSSSLATAVLVPERLAEPGGPANGRALAYLAHQELGNVFGTVYDVSTIAILWFAGASAMAGLLNLVPRYLPRYGMAPHWARAIRPLVLVFTAVGFVVTIVFDASVDKQGGAYATGVLVLITSASVAVTLSASRRSDRRATGVFGVISAVFVYTTVANIIERPDGLIIGSIFIVTILVVSFLSRAVRSFELRVTGVELDPTAARWVAEASRAGPLHLVANEFDTGDAAEYADKASKAHEQLHVPGAQHLLFLEVDVLDSSEFESELTVHGRQRHGYRILRLTSASVPNAIAALLLHLRDMTGARPHVYFEWSEGNPVQNLVRFVFIGVGEVAFTTREILREAEPDPERRPFVHVG
ncbi:amino acid transporter [Parafrankia colletiae]|uniref:Amino acid transporter n=1 Tax=Parafrankia colletiae TaxID=573497 RepID=A0A1S1R0X6_9ACTN|nr:amino acid transporter [Parafrankia colletiae]MCK9898690.1 amino acid transporter [Frankia sp. Cpl3]OHV39536.1 amino acid transporter [Parafrankia colletiae]